MPLNLSKLQQLRDDQNKDKNKDKEKPKGEQTAQELLPDQLQNSNNDFTEMMETIEPLEDPIMETLSEQIEEQEVVTPAPKPRVRKPRTPTQPIITPKPPITPTTPIFSVPEPNPQFTGKNAFFKNLASTMKDIKDNEFDELEDGSYTGFITDANFRESQAGNKMVIANIQITTKRGLPSKGEATKFFMIEHSNPQVVKIALRQLRNMLLTVGIVVDEMTDLEMILNNLGDYWKNKAVTFEVKKGFINIKEFHGKKA